MDLSFTFLATLFILLIISSAIILRSFILRRRFHRRVEEALQNGLYLELDNNVARPTLRVLGTKPRFHEVQVSEPTNLKDDESSDSGHGKSYSSASKLATFLPLAASLVPSSKPNLPRSHSQSTSTSALSSPTPPSSRSVFSQFRRRRAAPSGSGSTPPSANSPPPPDADAPSSTLAVSLLIAMPQPHTELHHHEHEHASNEDPVPNVEIGVTHVGARLPADNLNAPS
ncbi:hypothetical protein CONPUDRAFT_73126 [Coniophora puteana RWD-64-598 SS2]|uniref:Uncharacterized protein n=1 Tax=Coniophora puteana (strain RWD-64-598) TaxID=741705 RepID=A0A5M3MQD9_CONPW|nr:uncharacterized protein CONPUDRAFT_73126 [Coniophora puteana RWD-64-598 SS2]EIW81383.1 hypothetical protein CONPUDRAFT_73126 [Coniophora puteana RWD-64-598 SS2]